MGIFKRCAHRGRARDACEHPWWWKCVVGGRRVQVSLERHFRVTCRGRGSKTRATALVRTLRDQVLAGTFAATPDDVTSDLTVGAFVDVYADGYIKLRALKSAADRVQRLRKAARFFGDTPLAQLHQSDILAYLQTLQAAGAAPATLRRHYAYLHHALGWAESQELIDRNPIRRGGIALEAEDNERTRRMTTEEEQRLRAVADPWVADLMTLAISTGLRLSALLGLTWAHLRADVGQHGSLDLPARLLKGGKAQRLPLTVQARAVLDRRRADPVGQALPETAHVLGTELGEPVSRYTAHRRWLATCTAAGVAGLWIHDLRGEAASRLAELGVPLHVIQRFLGHSTLVMTQRYLRPRVGALDDAMAALEATFAATPPETPPPAPGRGVATESATVLPFRRRRA